MDANETITNHKQFMQKIYDVLCFIRQCFYHDCSLIKKSGYKVVFTFSCSRPPLPPVSGPLLTASCRPLLVFLALISWAGAGPRLKNLAGSWPSLGIYSGEEKKNGRIVK